MTFEKGNQYWKLRANNTGETWNKGKRGYSTAWKGGSHTEETKEKMRETQKRLYKEGKRICPKGMLGKENKWGHHSKETKEKISRNRKGKCLGEDNPSKRPEVREKKRMARLKRKEKLGYINSPEARMKIKLSLMGKVIPKKVRIKMSESHKGKRQSKTWVEKRIKQTIKTLHKKPNKPESSMIRIIEENNLPFNYVGNGGVMVDEFNPDFISKNSKRIIEVFGDYWHNLLKIRERDKRRLETYEKHGYKTLVIWEHELIDSTKVLNKINRFINNG